MIYTYKHLQNATDLTCFTYSPDVGRKNNINIEYKGTFGFETVDEDEDASECIG